MCSRGTIHIPGHCPPVGITEIVIDERAEYEEMQEERLNAQDEKARADLAERRLAVAIDKMKEIGREHRANCEINQAIDAVLAEIKAMR